MRSRQRYCVIVPAYNEAKHIGKVLAQLRALNAQIIVVDDGSADQTFSVAAKNCKHVLRHSLNLGKGASMKTGCEYAFGTLKSDGVIFFDADGQHHPKEISKFTHALDQGHDLVFGVRQLRSGMPWVRVMGNKALSSLVQFWFGAYIPDILSGFKAMSRRGYSKVRWDAQGYGVETEIVVRSAISKLSYATIPISTIYNRFDRGMTLVDALAILPKFVEWRVTL